MRMLQEHCCLVFICIMMITRKRFKWQATWLKKWKEMECTVFIHVMNMFRHGIWKIRLVRNHYLKLLIVQMIMEDEVHWHIWCIGMGIVRFLPLRNLWMSYWVTRRIFAVCCWKRMFIIKMMYGGWRNGREQMLRLHLLKIIMLFSVCLKSIWMRRKPEWK